MKQFRSWLKNMIISFHNIRSLDDSTKLINEAHSQVSTILTKVKSITSKQEICMTSFQTSLEINVAKMNKLILSFHTSLQNENETLSKNLFGLQKDNVHHHTSIANSILTLQISKAHENKIMDVLAEATRKIQFLKMIHMLTTKLNDATSKKATSKQGGNETLFPEVNIKNPYKQVQWKRTVRKPFGEAIYGRKIENFELDDLDLPLTKEQQENQTKCDAFLDELNALNVKLNAKEAKKKNAKEILANKKALFPPWSIERIEEEALNNPKLYYLEPRTSFSVDNDVDC
ncbi:unnamed protein product [Lactuca saligna]|uniref:Uncharacterized protein n=1 Tax=Lactuca saligna TaxID=75948 RepID=A0AA35Y3C9_LACSI|nr:unnamed protein product [Lactuca saligna]